MLEQMRQSCTVTDSLPESPALGKDGSVLGKSESKASQAGMLIINADDWGRDRENTDKIIDCVEHRTVSSVSAMVFMEDSARAADIALEKGIDAGLHLNLTTPFSLRSAPQRLFEMQRGLAQYLSWHRFAHVVFHPGLAKSFAYVVAAQLEEFEKLYGRAPSRIDGHHHAHLCANVLYANLLPEGTVVRRNFSFRSGEKSLANRTYRACVDRRLARRHRLVDYFFALQPLNSDSRLREICSYARHHVVEIETHPVNPEEYAFLQSNEVLRVCDGTRIAPHFMRHRVQKASKPIELPSEQDYSGDQSPDGAFAQVASYSQANRHTRHVVSRRFENTVLVGFAEAAAAAEVAWSLVDAGFRVIAFARKGRECALRHSRHVSCYEICAPELDLNAAMADLGSLLESVEDGSSAPPVLLPLDDKAVFLCSGLPKRERWALAGPAGISAELALDKYVQIQNAALAGFNVPKAVLASKANDIVDFVASEGFPIILKSAHCVPIRDGRAKTTHNWICADKSELDAALRKWNESEALLAQRFITGTGEGVFGLATADGVRAWSAHRRLRMMNPQGSGSSACISQMVSEDIRDKAELFVRQTGWRGMFMIELLRDPEGNIFFIEFNGRPWGSMALSRRQQLEYPAWQTMLALNPKSQAGLEAASMPGIVSRNIGRELMHLLFVLRGPGSRALGKWPGVWQSAANVIRIGRRETLYNWNARDRKVFFWDVYYTLKSNLLKSRN